MNDPRQYMRMMAFIRGRIEDGTYKPNELMPSMQELADQTGFSRHTIGKAMRMLQDEGLVTRTPGLGYVPEAAALGRPAMVPAAKGQTDSPVGWDRGGETHGRY